MWMNPEKTFRVVIRYHYWGPEKIRRMVKRAADADQIKVHDIDKFAEGVLVVTQVLLQKKLSDGCVSGWVGCGTGYAFCGNKEKGFSKAKGRRIAFSRALAEAARTYHRLSPNYEEWSKLYDLHVLNT